MSSKGKNKNRLIFILIENRSPITIRAIASKLNISEKTVRNYLNELQDDFIKTGVTLIKKPGVGIYLDIDNKKRSDLKENFNLEIDTPYSSEYRQKYILKTLFKNRYTYTIQLLADDLYCSKNTIINDLKYVEKWLENHKLHLKKKQSQGLWIEGDEVTFRNSMMSLFSEINHNLSQNSKAPENNIYEKLDYRIDAVNYKKIMIFFPNFDIIKVQNIIQESEEKLGYCFTDQAFINLIVHIAITLERAKFNKNIDIEHDYFKNIKTNKEYKIANWVVNELNKKFSLKIPEEESAYICIHMLGAKIQHNIYPDNLDDIINSKKEINVEIAKEIINLVSDILNINLRNDKLLLANLSIHLRTTIIRLKYNLQLRNPLLKRIKNEYLSIFGATYSCSIIFEKKLGISINEDEIGYICLHIAAAIERLNNKIKVVVVCSSGIGTSQIIATRLKKNFPQMDIAAIIPLRYLTDDVIQNNDLIVSTVPINMQSEKIIYISALLEKSDLTKIKNQIQNIIHDPQNIQNNTFSHIISPDYCFIDDGSSSYLNTIKKYAEIMEKNSIGKKGFSNNILSREQISSTIIGNGIAIPHSSEKFVLSPKICIIKLNNSVIWKHEYINLIFILALKFKDIDNTKLFFKNFYSLLDNEDLIRQIKQSNSQEKILSFFLNLNKNK